MSEPATIPAVPQAVQAEKAIVCLALRSPQWLQRAKAEGIDGESFWLGNTRLLWELAGSAPRGDDGEVDLIWANQHLTDAGMIDRVGGSYALADIWNYVYSPHAWPQWIGMLREAKVLRMATTLAQRLAESSDGDEAAQTAKDAAQAIQRAMSGARRAISAKDAVNSFSDQFKADHAAGDIPGKSTGIMQLDAITGGMKPGQLWVIGGKPSRGKSVLMLQIAGEFCLRAEAVVIFSLEMLAGEIIARSTSLVGRIHYGRITQPRTACRHDLEMILATLPKIAAWPLWIDDGANQTQDTIFAEAERIRDCHGSIALVVVDYLQLIRGGRNRNESREEEVARLSGGLKQLAKHLGCPVLSASQLNEDGRTRESKAIEQDADVLLYIAEDGLKMGKVRNGRRDDLLPLILDGEKQRFVENRNQ